MFEGSPGGDIGGGDLGNGRVQPHGVGDGIEGHVVHDRAGDLHDGAVVEAAPFPQKLREIRDPVRALAELRDRERRAAFDKGIERSRAHDESVIPPCGGQQSRLVSERSPDGRHAVNIERGATPLENLAKRRRRVRGRALVQQWPRAWIPWPASATSRGRGRS